MPRTVSYLSVIQLVASWMGKDPNVIEVEFERAASALFRYHARQVYEKAWWPEWCRMERRQFRPTWDVGEAVTAGAERYFPPTDTYYIALVASTGEAPATGSDYSTPNLAYWAEAPYELIADAHVNGRAYALGDRAQDPTTGLVYQCHTLHTGGSTLDTSKFGLLQEFVRNIDFSQSWEDSVIGAPEGVYPANPLVTHVWNKLEARPYGDGFLVPGNATRPWVYFRRPVPIFEGDNWSATATYAADSTLYFMGDFYTSTASTSAGESPATHPAKWELQPVLAVLANGLARYIHADMLEASKDSERAGQVLNLARAEISRQVREIYNKQPNKRRWSVMTR